MLKIAASRLIREAQKLFITEGPKAALALAQKGKAGPEKHLGILGHGLEGVATLTPSGVRKVYDQNNPSFSLGAIREKTKMQLHLGKEFPQFMAPVKGTFQKGKPLQLKMPYLPPGNTPKQVVEITDFLQNTLPSNNLFISDVAPAQNFNVASGKIYDFLTPEMFKRDAEILAVNRRMKKMQRIILRKANGIIPVNELPRSLSKTELQEVVTWRNNKAAFQAKLDKYSKNLMLADKDPKVLKKRLNAIHAGTDWQV